MSSSSSAPALGWSRSLRQPGEKPGGGGGGGGRPTAPARDRETTNNAPTADTRLNSPSKLPKFGTSASKTATATTARTAIPSTSTTAASGTRSRPHSAIFGLDRSNSTATTTTRKPATTQNDTTANPAPTKPARPLSMSSRLTRPKSISSAPTKLASSLASRPGPSTTTTTTPKPQPPPTKTHTRAKSQATALTSSTTLRPPRPPSVGSTASASTTTTTATAASKRPLGRLNPHARSVRQEQAPALSPTNKASALSASTTSTPHKASTRFSALNASTASTTNKTSTTNNPRAAKPPPPPTTTTTAATDDAPRLRPAFTSFQQHYSPARNLAPKPLTSTFLAPSSPSKLPANVAISSETARLQTELLQLLLLHRDADTVAAAWHASARDRLQTRFDALAGADKDVRADEAAIEEARNTAALAAWAADGEDLENKIQALDGVLSGLWGLGEPGGRYARVVRQFDKWYDGMVAAVEARRGAGGVGALTEGNEVAFVSELNPAWKEEVALLARKLDGWQRQLGKLPVDNNDGSGGGSESNEDGQGSSSGSSGSSSSSSLARILAGCRAQARDMLAELELMGQVERDAIGQEAAWIKRMNRDDDDDNDEADDDTPRAAGAIWRAF